MNILGNYPKTRTRSQKPEYKKIPKLGAGTACRGVWGRGAPRIFCVLARIAAAIALLFAVVAPASAARLTFIGDVMAHDKQLEAAHSGGRYDFGPQFRRVLPLFDGSLAVANLETVFAGAERGYAGYPMFNTPDSLADAMRAAGISVATIANNHILDKGERGIARTASVLDRAEIVSVGVDDAGPVPRLVEHDGVRIAFVSMTYGTNVPRAKSPDIAVSYISQQNVRTAMSRARALSPDLIAACVHWGVEYVYEPTKTDRATADLLLEEGADLVIGTHPHVLQPIEVRMTERGPKLIAWSLGNFVSYQRTLPRERSVILAVDVDGGELRRVSVAPTWVSARRDGGRRRIEVVYAGDGGSFAHTGLPKGELTKARAAGAKSLRFLGARDEPDDRGFYTIWSADEPDLMPRPGSKSPM